jgi:hypothetical protein
MADVSYHGGEVARLQPGGELTTDRKGLVTGQLVFLVPPGKWGLVPCVDSAHIHAGFCHMEKRKVAFTPGWWTVTCDYTGCEPGSKEDLDDDSSSSAGESSSSSSSGTAEANYASGAAYEFSPGTGTEPIDTCDNFVSEIGGTAAHPKNGAIFLDANGIQTWDNARGVFSRFLLSSKYKGVQEYYTANNSVWTKSWTQTIAPGSASRGISVTTNPPGPSPSFGGKHNWLVLPTFYTKRGRVYDCRQTFLLSGPRGWDSTIYKG